MKLEKVIGYKDRQKRWYDDACGTALAMELVGERWSLLIVRELMFGPRRFGEIRANLGGISANVLTQRLTGLEQAGVLARRILPSPANVQVYELTEWGYQSEGAIRELGRWAARSPEHDTSLPLSAASLMLSFRTMFARDRADGLHARIGFRFGTEEFIGDIDGEWIHIRRGAPVDSGVVFDSDPMTMASIVYGRRPFEDAEQAGALRIEGDRALAARFATLFVLPPRAAP